MSFSERLKEARNIAGLSQKELGEMIGVTGNAVSNYENGTSSPNDKILLRMFDALNVDPNFLFQDSFSNKKAPAEKQELSKDERDLLTYFERLDADGRRMFLALAAYIDQVTSKAHLAPDLSPEEVVREELTELACSQPDSREAAAEQ